MLTLNRLRKNGILLGFLLFYLAPSDLPGQGTSRFDSLELRLASTIPDSTRIQILCDLAWGLSRTNPQKALVFADSLLGISQRIGSRDFTEKAHYYYGVIYKNTGQHTRALQYFRKFQTYFDSIGAKPSVADVLYQIATVQKTTGDFEEALRSYQQTLTIYQELEEKPSISITLSAMGGIYRELRQYDKALDIYRQSVDVLPPSDQTSRRAAAYSNIGNVYTEQGRYDTAHTYYQMALELDQANQDKWGIAYDLEHIGEIRMANDDLTRALEALNQSLALRRQLDNKREIAVTYTLLGQLYRKMGLLTMAIENLETARKLCEKQGFKPELRKALKYLSETYGDQGRYQLALNHYQAYVAIKDSLLNARISEQLAEMDAKFEASQKEQEIALLNSKTKIQELQIARGRRNLLAAISALLFVLAITALLYLFYQQKQRDHQTISTALEEKEILLREIHHRVKNNMQFISSLLGLQTEHVADETVLSALREGQDRVQSMALIHQNLYQDDLLTGVVLEDYFIKLIRNLFDSYNIRRDQVQLELDIPQITLELDSVTPIGLVVNELISNSLKYAFPDQAPGVIRVSLREVTEGLLLSVADNGVGMSETGLASLGSSFGYRLINVFKDQLRADLSVDGTDGMVVTMRIRKYKRIA